MKLLNHFPAIGVSNTYVIGPDAGGEAILVDPGRFDVTLLNLIEDNDFNITSVLVTHDHDNHIKGLKTLKKVYDFRIIAGSRRIYDFEAEPVSHGMKINASGFDIEVIDVEGHSPDSRVYRVGAYLFTGDVLSAGRVGSSPTKFTRELLLRSIHEKISSIHEDLLILPGHGPPTTIGAEQRWNPDLRIHDNE